MLNFLRSNQSEKKKLLQLDDDSENMIPFSIINKNKYKRPNDSNEESMILEKMKKRRQCDDQNQENEENDESEDRLSDLPDGKICGSGLSSVKQVNISAEMITRWDEPPMILLSWLLDLANVKSLTVTSTTLWILSLAPDLLEVKLPSLCILKSMEIKLEPLCYQHALLYMVKGVMLKKAAAKSRKEVAKLQREFKAESIQPNDDKSSHEDKVKKRQPNTNFSLLDNGSEEFSYFLTSCNAFSVNLSFKISDK
ncbi:hypothetical protein QL285_070738 [Trifolium repens]|nr:hypothetical protein QL285_070738 [Trifolium repens]